MLRSGFFHHGTCVISLHHQPVPTFIIIYIATRIMAKIGIIFNSYANSQDIYTDEQTPKEASKPCTN
jgi:hypothetical protein